MSKTTFVIAVLAGVMAGSAYVPAAAQAPPPPIAAEPLTPRSVFVDDIGLKFKLKLDGDKLTGAMVGRDNQETAIDEASFKENVVTFKVTRERNGQKFTTKYNGTVKGDEIKGKTESERDGKTNSRDWVAKRSK